MPEVPGLLRSCWQCTVHLLPLGWVSSCNQPLELGGAAQVSAGRPAAGRAVWQRGGGALWCSGTCTIDNCKHHIHPREQCPAAYYKQDEFQQSGAWCCVGRQRAASHSIEEGDTPTAFQQWQRYRMLCEVFRAANCLPGLLRQPQPKLETLVRVYYRHVHPLQQPLLTPGRKQYLVLSAPRRRCAAALQQLHWSCQLPRCCQQP